jgi:hypothetical protein
VPSQRVTAFAFLISPLLCAVPSFAQAAHYAKNGPALLPDLNVTIGQSASITRQKVCTTVWGKDERHVTQTMKNSVYAKYGTSPGKGVCAFKTHKSAAGKTIKEGCEVDHLISRELGGADNVDNLWPQPYTQHPGAHEKDWLENELHKEVCKGTITLDQAQNEIKTDWYAAYLKRRPAP